MTPPATTEDLRLRLVRRFVRQRDFAAVSSPLAARLCDLVAGWLANQEEPLTSWLLKAARSRASFDVPMLLLAGLHREVLSGATETIELARFFPTVGGDREPDDNRLASALGAAILGCRARLADFLQQATVQTNETARGLCWLLPAYWTNWPEIHLVDLGASAGLNLIADQRQYLLTGPDKGRPSLLLGAVGPEDFTVVCEGVPCPLVPHPLPVILTRTGCDLAPVLRDSFEAEQTLAAFVWGDQPRRMTSLRRGIEILHRVNQGPAPVRLHSADLPANLPHFLDDHCRWPDQAPLLLTNTYLTAYLASKGAALWSIIDSWAAIQPRPVLWAQWEPLRQERQPPQLGWLAWTIDLWLHGRHATWHLAWVHPHGSRLVWLPGLTDWADFWDVSRKEKERTIPPLPPPPFSC